MTKPVPTPAYTKLTTFFNSNPGRILHIEFYPTQPDTPPKILTSGPNIAIPKPLLLQAFQTAHPTFSSADATKQEILDSSLVLLLIASESLTAVNARRKIILDRGARSGRDEIQLIASFLTSPLNKHNKSPLLWSYRRWLIERFGDLEEGIGAELGVVEASGEMHPRNYYAWNHARFATTFFLPRSPSHPQLSYLLDRTENFALSHVSDTSVWSFLQFLFFQTLEQPDPHTFRVQLGEIVWRSMEFVHVLARGHESVWVFVRTVLGSKELLDAGKRRELVGVLEGWVRGDVVDVEDARRERMLEERALAWIGKYRGGGVSTAS
ncbi:hypothetical protein L873DRAFT_1307062 [Choiromyces venosus 120613-1]|uniref:Protein prenylyltransferase n=1 Tax=Choiromyces venosus 120613-1 TaxID=1336337 RepID=A0A3N4JFT2_9PEZI|nr:hypothetical protein L873DRAFT_1307062 [Choiromyces venosus 120613-1]